MNATPTEWAQFAAEAGIAPPQTPGQKAQLMPMLLAWRQERDSALEEAAVPMILGGGGVLGGLGIALARRRQQAAKEKAAQVVAEAAKKAEKAPTPSRQSRVVDLNAPPQAENRQPRSENVAEIASSPFEWRPAADQVSNRRTSGSIRGARDEAGFQVTPFLEPRSERGGGLARFAGDPEVIPDEIGEYSTRTLLNDPRWGPMIRAADNDELRGRLMAAVRRENPELVESMRYLLGVKLTGERPTLDMSEEAFRGNPPPASSEGVVRVFDKKGAYKTTFVAMNGEWVDRGPARIAEQLTSRNRFTAGVMPSEVEAIGNSRHFGRATSAPGFEPASEGMVSIIVDERGDPLLMGDDTWPYSERLVRPGMPVVVGFDEDDYPVYLNDGKTNGRQYFEALAGRPLRGSDTLDSGGIFETYAANSDSLESAFERMEKNYGPEVAEAGARAYESKLEARDAKERDAALRHEGDTSLNSGDQSINPFGLQEITGREPVFDEFPWMHHAMATNKTQLVAGLMADPAAAAAKYTPEQLTKQFGRDYAVYAISRAGSSEEMPALADTALRSLSKDFNVSPADVKNMIRRQRDIEMGVSQNETPRTRPVSAAATGAVGSGATEKLVAGLGAQARMSHWDALKSIENNPNLSSEERNLVAADLAASYMSEVPDTAKLLGTQLGGVLGGMPIDETVSLVGEAYLAAARDYPKAVEWLRQGGSPLGELAGFGNAGGYGFDAFARTYTRRYVLGRAMSEKNSGAGSAVLYNMPEDVGELMVDEAFARNRPVHEIIGEKIAGASSPMDAVWKLDGIVSNAAGKVGREPWTNASVAAESFWDAAPEGTEVARLKAEVGLKSLGGYSLAKNIDTLTSRLPVALKFSARATEPLSGLINKEPEDSNRMIQERVVDNPFWRDAETGEVVDAVPEGKRGLRAFFPSGPVNRVLETQYTTLENQRLKVMDQYKSDIKLARRNRDKTSLAALTEKRDSIRGPLEAEQRAIIERQKRLNDNRVRNTLEIDQLNKEFVSQSGAITGSGLLLDVEPVSGRVAVLPDGWSGTQTSLDAFESDVPESEFMSVDSRQDAGLNASTEIQASKTPLTEVEVPGGILGWDQRSKMENARSARSAPSNAEAQALANLSAYLNDPDRLAAKSEWLSKRRPLPVSEVVAPTIVSQRQPSGDLPAGGIPALGTIMGGTRAPVRSSFTPGVSQPMTRQESAWVPDVSPAVEASIRTSLGDADVRNSQMAADAIDDFSRSRGSRSDVAWATDSWPSSPLEKGRPAWGTAPLAPVPRRSAPTMKEPGRSAMLAVKPIQEDLPKRQRDGLRVLHPNARAMDAERRAAEATGATAAEMDDAFMSVLRRRIRDQVEAAGSGASVPAVSGDPAADLARQVQMDRDLKRRAAAIRASRGGA